MGARRAALALLAAVCLAGCEPMADQAADRVAAEAASAAPTHVQEPTSAPGDSRPTSKPTTTVQQPGLLFPAKGGDGDSWKDTQGREYRLGLINTPELNECFGQAASDRRKQLTKTGFVARVYSKDNHGRLVADVHLADGRDLNVLLARTGYANDTYLATFRHENRQLAAELDQAFAAAKKEKAGLWGRCAAKPKPAPTQPASQSQPQSRPQPLYGGGQAGSSCHPDYATCVPIKGDGSGAGDANDLDCGDLRKLVLLEQIGTDPYRLDGEDQDGRGCESYA